MSERKPNPIIQEIINNNPIEEFLGYNEPENITTRDDIRELQDVLMQTCIDYIKEHNLTDVASVLFSVDDIQPSVEEGKWIGFTDSYCSCKGIKWGKYRRKDNTTIEIPEYYLIDESF